MPGTPYFCHPDRSAKRAVEGPAFILLPTTPMKYEHHYYVYLVASRTRVLYCGVTNDICRRVAEHRAGSIAGFSAKYLCQRLVWYERYQYINNAIDREKQIKRWNRAKKLWLIEQMNPTWIDLSESWRPPNTAP
jgi:putative endonuclease